MAIATINARATAEQLAIARSTLAYQDDNLQIARWRNQAGLVSSLDVEQARTQRAQTAATIPLLESNLAATANSISTLIGEPPGRVLAAIVATEPEPVPAPPLLAGFEAPAEVLRRRPDVRSAEASLFASTARIGVARAQLLPLVRLIRQYRHRVGYSRQPVRHHHRRTVCRGQPADLRWRTHRGAGRQCGSGRARHRWRRGSKPSWTRWKMSKPPPSTCALRMNALSSTRRRCDAADNSALLARSQYQAGLTDFRTLLTAENQLLSARNQLVSAQADRAIAFVRLTQALGGGWTISDYDLPPVASSAPATSDRTAQ